MKQFSSPGETRAKAHPASKRRDRSGLIMAGVAVLLFVVVIPGNTPLLGQFTYTCSIGQSVSYSSPNMTIDFSFFTQSPPPGAGQLLTVLMVLFGVPGQQGPIAIPISTDIGSSPGIHQPAAGRLSVSPDRRRGNSVHDLGG